MNNGFIQALAVMGGLAGLVSAIVWMIVGVRLARVAERLASVAEEMAIRR